MSLTFNPARPAVRRILLIAAWLGLALLATTLRAQAQVEATHAHDHAAESSAPTSLIVPIDEIVVNPTLAGTGGIFYAALSGGEENPVVYTKASGYAVLALNEAQDKLSYRVLASDIVSITAAHIHEGLPGVNGGVIIALNVGAGGTISGTADITPDQVVKLIAGEYYVNVHTENHGGGEIRGQVLGFSPPSAYNALLTGAQETPPVENTSIGVARFALTGTGTLDYEIAISNTTAITLGHIHRGAIGVAGPAVHTLYTGTVAFDAQNPLTGSVELDAQGMVDLLTGYYYVNFHSATFPAGELRGQINGAQLFVANLDGNQENPRVDTLAHGRGVLALSNDARTLVYRVTVNDLAEIQAAHIHRGVRGVNGGVEFPLPSFPSGDTISGTISITDVHVLRLISGGYYVNVHTADHGGGEIRGQVEPYTPPANLSALLTGDQEVPAVETEAAGFARLKLNSGLGVLNYYVAVSNIPSITLAHIHKGPLGVSGGVAIDLYPNPNGSFSPERPLSGVAVLGAQKLVDLLTGYYYVNVHTEANGGGEIRGQIGGAHTFTAPLDGAQEVPARSTDAFGMGVLGLSADASTLWYRVSVNELNNVTASHIHNGAAGSNGPVIFDLKGAAPFNAAQPISGSLVLTDAHVLALVSGDYYVNVHTRSYPGGEIRGQIGSYVPQTDWNALLSSRNETPPVEEDAAGVARITVEPLLGLAHYRIDVTNTVSVTLAHIHRAPLGTPGPVALNLYTPDGSFTNDHPLIGNTVLDGRAWVDLLSGYAYVNVHTADHPGGIMRGQVMGVSAFRADLSGANEVPAVTTDASGVGTLALSADASSLSYRVTVTDIVDVLMAHIHIGATGENGGVRFTLWDNGPGLFDPANPISGTLELTTADLQNLAAGKFYINVHTAANGGGEIRGQVESDLLDDAFQTILSEAAEVGAASPLTVTASGLAAFQLNAWPAATLQYQVDVRDIPTVTMAHIHKGLPGTNGGVVFGLYPAPGDFAPGNPISGIIPLSAPELVDLLTGYYYVNVHTVDLPGGHVRGQIDVTGEASANYLPAVIYDEMTPE